MKLITSTWMEVEDYLKSNKGIIIPIGSTEQHGPNGLMGTDSITSETISNKIQKNHNVLIGPTLNLGVAQYHLNFPGTIAIKPTTLISILLDVIQSLSKHGFKHVYFINGHGGNVSTIEAAFDEYYHSNSISKNECDYAKCRLYNWWMYETVDKISKKYFDGIEGAHATPCEIAIAHYAYPEYIHDKKIIPLRAPELSYMFDSNDYRKRYPDGRIGSDSRLTTKEIGEEIVLGLVDEIWKDYSIFMNS